MESAAGHSLKRGVRVPHIVPGQELGLAVIIAKLGAIWLHIANGAEILNPAFLTQRHMAWFGWAEALRKGQLNIIIGRLIWEMNERVFVDQRPNLFG